MKKFIIALMCGAFFYAGSAFAAVNVNTADASQLGQLTGIGTVKAQAIIKDRQKNGDYKQLEQLTRVDGIGEKTVAGLRSEATVSAKADENNGS